MLLSSVLLTGCAENAALDDDSTFDGGNIDIENVNQVYEKDETVSDIVDNIEEAAGPYKHVFKNFIESNTKDFELYEWVYIGDYLYKTAKPGHLYNTTSYDDYLLYKESVPLYKTFIAAENFFGKDNFKFFEARVGSRVTYIYDFIADNGCRIEVIAEQQDEDYSSIRDWVFRALCDGDEEEFNRNTVEYSTDIFEKDSLQMRYKEDILTFAKGGKFTYNYLFAGENTCYVYVGGRLDYIAVSYGDMFMFISPNYNCCYYEEIYDNFYEALSTCGTWLENFMYYTDAAKAQQQFTPDVAK